MNCWCFHEDNLESLTILWDLHPGNGPNSPSKYQGEKNPLGFPAGKGKGKHFEIGQSTLFTTRDALEVK